MQVLFTPVDFISLKISQKQAATSGFILLAFIPTITSLLSSSHSKKKQSHQDSRRQRNPFEHIPTSPFHSMPPPPFYPLPHSHNPSIQNPKKDIITVYTLKPQHPHYLDLSINVFTT